MHLNQSNQLSDFMNLFADCNVAPSDLNALSLYKLSRQAREACGIALSHKYELLNKVFCSCIIPSSVRISEGTEFAYGGLSVLVHKDSVIGSDCSIGTHVVIGGNASSKQYILDENMNKQFVPRLLDNVFVASGAKILGGLEIGSYSIIGANAVVTRSIPPFSVVAGNPAVQIAEINRDSITKYKGFFKPTRLLTWEDAQDFIAEVIMDYNDSLSSPS